MTNVIAPQASAKPSDFADLVNLLDQLSGLELRASQLTTDINAEHLATVRVHTDTYKELQTKIGEINAAIDVLVPRNPQWLADKKSIETPFGTVKRTTSTKLIIADEALSITLIEADKRGDDFVVTTKKISREALEDLGDDELKKYGIRRETTFNYKAEPAGIDLGKAVKAADKSEKAAAKTAKKAAGGES